MPSSEPGEALSKNTNKIIDYWYQSISKVAGIKVFWNMVVIKWYQKKVDIKVYEIMICIKRSYQNC